MVKSLAIVVALITAMPTFAYAGNCNVASDTASDGSRCGGRASSEREGGN
jgi:hypothetical protein